MQLSLLTNPAHLPCLHPPTHRSREQYEQVFSTCGGVYWNATEGSPCDRALNRVWHAGQCKGQPLGCLPLG